MRPTRIPRAEMAVIGRAELVRFPDWHVALVRAKVDTGAATSAIHVGAYGPERSRKTKPERSPRTGDLLHVLLLLDHGRTRWVEAVVVRTTRVRSSNGRTEQRPVVATTIEVAGQRYTTEVTLSRERTGMGFRMLLGRSSIAGRFLVDPGRAYAASPHVRVAP